MPSVRYFNQTAPFWDFIAGLEDQGASHPWFANNHRNLETLDAEDSNAESGTEGPPGPPGRNPWAQGWPAFPFGGPMPHRGRHDGPRGGRGGPHGRHGHHGSPPPGPPPDSDHDMSTLEDEKEAAAGPSDAAPAEGSGPEKKRGHGPHGRGGRRCGRGGPASWGAGRGRAGPHGGPRGGPQHPFRGFGGLAQVFQDQLFGEESNKEQGAQSFNPEVDVFDTTESFVVHVSLPGAQKDDVGVNWDAEKSELTVAGVVHRPGDEELLKTLAMNERKIGVFERKIRLGSRASPAQVDVDGITARMENGVLRVEVPKADADYVEIKKVDIQ